MLPLWLSIPCAIIAWYVILNALWPIGVALLYRIRNREYFND